MEREEIRKVIEDILIKTREMREEVKRQSLVNINNSNSNSNSSDREEVINNQEQRLKFPIDKVGWLQESDSIEGHFHITLDGAFSKFSREELDIRKLLGDKKFHRVRIKVEEI